jgi:hypothetical protein
LDKKVQEREIGACVWNKRQKGKKGGNLEGNKTKSEAARVNKNL